MEKELADISVSEITKAAQVSRNSFYRNFADKEEIVQKHIASLLNFWSEFHKNSGSSSNALMYGTLFEHMKNNSDFYLLLKKRKLMHLFLTVFLDTFGPKQEYENMWAYTTAFIAYGTYGWIEEWIVRGMQESAETMADLLSSHGMK